jgi:hypothetical protein
VNTQKTPVVAAVALELRGSESPRLLATAFWHRNIKLAGFGEALAGRKQMK